MSECNITGTPPRPAPAAHFGVRYASVRMLLVTAPGLPLVVGLPFALLLAMTAVTLGIWFVMGRLTRP